MAIELYAHNRDAYEAVKAMLYDKGKAAVVHPTGTGKSFIGFKLCEENQEKQICWLSPSEYIFETQLENLKAASDGYEPENICFFTYAKLMQMYASELEQIRPDYIILDEFHRCGAQMWGAGVKALLDCYPDVPVLGLSATNIRYLDNQRDMAQELFGGNIASEMSLGEAIVRGILNPPKYVLSLFSCQKGLQKYERRVQSAKSKAVRDEGEQYLEALRRALEKAEGLNEIFRKHMENRTGKYIVFCASFEHMQEMIQLSTEWFSEVDEYPHIYSAYSDDPSTDQSFADFKADNSDHLKLLYCIDMLNEGIHVEDVDGVILLRPTISPIIYKQQIGRALSAGKKRNAVIFDIVMNIENLYSIGAIEEEMKQVMFNYRSHGRGDEIVNDRFQVIDEVRDCMELFSRLNDSLTASWNIMYQFAKQYYAENGDLEVPRRYITPEGYALGSWLDTQRKVFTGKVPGKLTEKQIEKLDALGMRWGDLLSKTWDMYYEALCAYRAQHGNLDVLARFETEDGIALGRFITNLRIARAKGTKNGFLTPERIEALDKLGMIWAKVDYKWEANYLACTEYYLEHHDLNIPSDYVSKDGLRIGAWIRRQRRIRDGRGIGAVLSEDQIRRLDEIGMNWQDAQTIQWEYGYQRARQYHTVHGDLNVPSTYVDEEGFALGRWVRRHNEKRANGATVIKLTPERRERMEALGMVWKTG